MKSHHSRRPPKYTLLLVLSLFVIHTQRVDAGYLGLTSRPPDITSHFVSVTYDATTHVFRADGIAGYMDVDGLPGPDDYYLYTGADFGGGFVIDMTVNPVTGKPTTGTLLLTGTIPTLGATSGKLLEGSIKSFGFGGAGDPVFEFVFSGLTGDLAPRFGSEAGVILNVGAYQPDKQFTGSFEHCFANDGFADSNTFPIPEPLSAAVWGLLTLTVGATVVCQRRRRR